LSAMTTMRTKHSITRFSALLSASDSSSDGLGNSCNDDEPLSETDGCGGVG